MLQLLVTDEAGAVTAHYAEHFPFLIGRSQSVDLQVASAGVFDEHARIELAPENDATEAKFFIHALGKSLLLVNGETVPSRRLHMGDEIRIGATRLFVSLAPARQSALAVHESLVWLLLVIVVFGEAALIHFAR